METATHYLQALEDQAQEQRDHERHRLALSQRLLWMLLPALLILLLERILRAPRLAPLTALGISFDLGALALLSVRPRAQAVILRCLGLAFVALLALEARFTPSLSEAVGLQFLPLLCLAGLLMDSVWLGLLLWGLGLGILGLASWAAPQPSAAGQLTLMLLGASATAGLGSAWVWHSVLEEGQTQLRRWQDLLHEQWQRRQGLRQILFNEQVEALARLRRAVTLPRDQAWPLLRQELEALGELQTQAQVRRQALPETPIQGWDELGFQRRALRLNLLIGMAVSLGGLLVHTLTGQLNPWTSAGAVILFAALLPLLRQPDQPQRWLLGLCAWVGPLSIGINVVQGRPEGLYFMPFAILGGALLVGFRQALAVTLLGLVFLGASIGAWNERLGEWALQAPVLAVVWIACLGVCALSLDLRSRLLKDLDRQGRQLAQDLRVQRRLLGALHHDLANLQTALLGISDLGRAGLTEDGDWGRVRRLLDRLGQLLEGGEDLLLGEQALDPGLLRPVALVQLAASMHELFNERLRDKRLSLGGEIPPALAARGVASLLRDSVLSNLVSNAIKHSRPGSAIDMVAWSEKGEVALAVLDRGPGLAPGALEHLRLGQEQPGGVGSAGEPGQGLGLLLAREHLQRQGGRLELRARDGGGTIAIAWMRPA